MKGEAARQFWMLPTYWNWVRSEAEAHGTDGCSVVTGAHVECCFEHDLGYRFAKDPRDAYFRFRGGAFDPWKDAKPITRAEVDARFRQCHMNRSRFGRWSPMAWWRWAGVSMGAEAAWDRHRAREKEAGV